MHLFQRRLVAPAAAVMMGLTILAGSAQGKNVGRVANRQAGLSSLPVAAQPFISSTLGSETPGYEVVNAGAVAEARNPSQHLQSYFTSTGVQVSQGAASWEMSFHGYGRGAGLTAATVARPQVSSNRVEYRRGSLTEWYANGPLGLEQGFTISRAPAGAGPLTIAVDLSGGLTAALSQDRNALILAANGQQVMQYTGLSASDATGKDLRAWLEMKGQRLLVRVDDARARYPVVVDPFVQEAELTASNATTNDYFGYSVAAYGQTIVVGAPEATVGSKPYQGAAYVFVAAGTGWKNATQTAELTSSNGATDDFFGWSVGIGSGGVVVGAFGHNAYTGMAYVFVQPTGGWVNSTETAQLTDSGGLQYDFFGYSVAISGNVIVVGTPNHNIATNTPAGAAYVYQQPRTGWVTTSAPNAQLTSSDEAQNAYFASSVAIAGGTVVIGAPFASGDLGAAYIYVKPGSGWKTTTAYTAKLTASDGVTYDDFGYSVGVGGTGSNTVAIGAPGVNVETGAVYIFIEPALGGWVSATQTAKLTSLDSSEGDNFGYAVGVSANGTYVVSGAPNAVVTGKDLAGAAYAYAKPSGGWVNTSTYSAKLRARDGAESAHFGHAVQVVNAFSVVGAYEGTISSQFLGSSYVFTN